MFGFGAPGRDANSEDTISHLYLFVKSFRGRRKSGTMPCRRSAFYLFVAMASPVMVEQTHFHYRAFHYVLIFPASG